MRLDNFHEIIATRILTLSNESEVIEVSVLVGKPTIYPGGSDYFAPYQILGIGSEKIGYACGIDTIQSLQLTLKMIRFDLESINKSFKNRLLWAGDEKGRFGVRLRC